MRHHLMVEDEPGTGLKVGAALLGCLYLVTGGIKLAGMKEMEEEFEHWGYPKWVMQAAGVAEVAGGLMLMSNRTRRIGAWTLSMVMGGAAATHLSHGEKELAAVPGALLLPLLALTRGPRRQPVMDRVMAELWGLRKRVFKEAKPYLKKARPYIKQARKQAKGLEKQTRGYRKMAMREAEVLQKRARKGTKQLRKDATRFQKRATRQAHDVQKRATHGAQSFQKQARQEIRELIDMLS